MKLNEINNIENSEMKLTITKEFGWDCAQW